MKRVESPVRLRAAFKTPAGWRAEEGRLDGVPYLSLTRGGRSIRIRVYGYFDSVFQRPEEFLASLPDSVEAGTVRVAGADRTLYRRSFLTFAEEFLVVPCGKGFLALSCLGPPGEAWKGFLKGFRLKPS